MCPLNAHGQGSMMPPLGLGTGARGWLYGIGVSWKGVEAGRRQRVLSGKLGLTMYIPGQVPDLPPKVLEALLRGERSEAIEQFRLEQNLGLEEARDLVATYIMSQPSLQRRMKDSQSEARWGAIRWLILLQAIAVALGYFLLFRE